MQQSPILLYDIDGTLLHVKRDFILSLIEEQLDHYDIHKDEANTRSFAGRTDRGIFMELIGDRPDAENLFGKVMLSYSNAMDQQLSEDHVEVHGGAISSVTKALSLNLKVGLCTGNVRSVAMKKVATAGLNNTFSFGGFGDISENRNDLPGAADRDYRQKFGDTPDPHRYVIIGDTPHDIRCAHHFGARSVAVTTGSFSEEELKAHQPDLIVTSLHNPEKWLRHLGFTI